MEARKIGHQLRGALRGSGLSLWELSRRAEVDIAEVAAALGGTRLLPVDQIEGIGAALGVELALVASAPPLHYVGPVMTVVETVIEKVTPERLVYPGNEVGITTLALDLEATLVSNAVSMFVRPGLHEFLQCARGLFQRVVMFTTVREDKFREVAGLLVDEGAAPAWFRTMEYIHWRGKTKDLTFVPGARPEQVLLVDDLAQYVHEGQEGQWIPITPYEPPFKSDDDELRRVLQVLVERRIACDHRRQEPVVRTNS